jgi:hypothetical protein
VIAVEIGALSRAEERADQVHRALEEILQVQVRVGVRGLVVVSCLKAH